MTRPELHALADIVMDAREIGININLFIMDAVYVFIGDNEFLSTKFETFSDFTQAVKEYIKTLNNQADENKN